MTGYMIKFTDDCPAPKLRNTYFSINPNSGTSHYSIFDSFKAAEHKLRQLKYRQWGKIIEFELVPRKEWVPTEHFYAPPKGLIYLDRGE